MPERQEKGGFAIRPLRPNLMAPGVGSHIFEDHLLVFSEKTQILYNFNPSAAFMWCCCEQGMSEEEIAQAVVAAFGVGIEEARHDVRNATQEWMSLGLVESAPDDPPTIALSEMGSETSDNLLPSEPLTPHPLSSTYAFELAGQGFVLRFSDENLKWSVIEPLLHLSADDVSSPVTIDVFESEERYVITREKVIVAGCAFVDELAPLVAQEALHAACQGGDFLVCIHAAVHSLGKACIVLPGVGGTGKTTLSAALIKDGFRYFTDEVALLDRRTLRVVPAPVSLRVKQGSWKMVSGMFPDFLTLPTHSLTDGSRLRLLPPPAGSFQQDPEEGNVVKCLVFLSRSSEEKTFIRPLSRIEVFQRIQECGYSVVGILDQRTVAQILQWIKTVDCYEMTMNSLPEAVEIVRGLLE